MYFLAFARAAAAFAAFSALCFKEQGERSCEIKTQTLCKQSDCGLFRAAYQAARVVLSSAFFKRGQSLKLKKKSLCVYIAFKRKKKSLMCVEEDECVACEGEEKEQHVVKVCVTTTTSVLLGALLGALFLALFLGLLLCRFCRLFLLTLLLTLLLLGALLFLRSRGG